MIFQDALAALHPFYKIGGQLAEAYLVHHPNATKRDARRKAIEMLDRVGIPQPDRRVDDFPHQFSGGMRQRAMIAMGLINDPSLLIADEPTTALDVTVQAQILDLLQDLQREFNSAVIIITHDLGVIAEMADDVLVMYAGRAVEYGPCKEILTHPEMPYTWGLLSSVPDVAADTDARLIPIPGNPPSLLSPPSGCAFHPRCAHVDKVPGNLCTTELPELLARQPRWRPPQALPPGRPRRGLRGRGAARDRPRAGRGELMSDVNVDKPDASPDRARPGARRGRAGRGAAGRELLRARRAGPHRRRPRHRRPAGPRGREPQDVLPGRSPRALIRRTVGHVQAVDGISLPGAQGRLAGPGGGVRLWQVHDRAA